MRFQSTSSPPEKFSCPPIFAKRYLFCAEKYCSDHIAEVTTVRKGEEMTSLPKHPVFFTKAITTLTPHLGKVPCHTGITSYLDYEAQLALVIGIQVNQCSTFLPLNRQLCLWLNSGERCRCP